MQFDRTDLKTSVNCVLLSLFLTFSIFLTITVASAKNNSSEVVVYTSVDQVFSEPLLDLFEKKTNLRVRAVFDVEAAKTVGLVNRLLAEKHRPKADVFWNSEITRTILLKEKGLLIPYFSPSAKDIPDFFKDKDGYWTGFSCRARVLIYNTTLLSSKDAPTSIFDLSKPEWSGRVAMAFPLLGTTATHIGALYSQIGKENIENFLGNLKGNQVMIVSGNSVVRDIVASGRAAVGLTDTDDVLTAMARNQPVDMIFPDQNGIGTFIIPNSVAMIKNAPHPEAAKKLIDFLLSKEVEELLAQSGSANIPVRKGVPPPDKLPSLDSLKIMQVDYQKAAAHVPVSDRFCHNLFSN